MEGISVSQGSKRNPFSHQNTSKLSKVTLMSKYIINIPTWEREEGVVLPFRANGITPLHWVLPASQPVWSTKRHTCPHWPCWVHSAFSLAPAVSPNYCLCSRVNVNEQNLRHSLSYVSLIQAILKPQHMSLYLAYEQCWTARLNCMQFCEIYLYLQ